MLSRNGTKTVTFLLPVAHLRADGRVVPRRALHCSVMRRRAESTLSSVSLHRQPRRGWRGTEQGIPPKTRRVGVFLYGDMLSRLRSQDYGVIRTQSGSRRAGTNPCPMLKLFPAKCQFRCAISGCMYLFRGVRILTLREFSRTARVESTHRSSLSLVPRQRPQPYC